MRHSFDGEALDWARHRRILPRARDVDRSWLRRTTSCIALTDSKRVTFSDHLQLLPMRDLAVRAKSDPAAAALWAGLDAAIAEGRTLDAAQIATDLAARARAVRDPKVVPFAPKRRR